MSSHDFVGSPKVGFSAIGGLQLFCRVTEGWVLRRRLTALLVLAPMRLLAIPGAVAYSMTHFAFLELLLTWLRPAKRARQDGLTED